MAFRVIKQRREARRNAKLEEIFLVSFLSLMNIVLSLTQERDKLQNETISRDDMMDVFRIYGVTLQFSLH